MPKLKTRKSVSKRIVKVTKNDQLLRRNLSAQHRTTGKSARTKRAARSQSVVAAGDIKLVRSFIPYR